jgi:hypothetical protein
MPFGRMFVIAICCSTVVYANETQVEIVDTLRRVIEASDSPTVMAEGCLPTFVSGCNTEIRGRLGVGDCTLSNGTYLDSFFFDGRAGEVVAITVRPLSSTLSRPVVTIVPPSGDASKTPIVFGARFASIFYKLSSTGRWGIGVGTTDLFASGEYLLQIECLPDDSPADPQNCVGQELLCGDTGGWQLTSQGCRFSSGQRVYGPWYIYGVAGDSIFVEMESSDFDPLFGIYGDDLLVSSTEVNRFRDIGTLFVPRNDWYMIAATSEEEATAGFYTVKVSCASSGCLFPTILTQLTDVTVGPHGSAQLSVEVSSAGQTTMEWWDVTDTFTQFVAGTGTTFRTPAVTGTRYYQFRASNACGDASTRIVKVTAESGRRRAVRR